MSSSASITWLVWLPMLVFEVALVLWLMIRSVNMERLKMTESGQAKENQK